METDGSVLMQCLDRLNYTLGYKTHCGEERTWQQVFIALETPDKIPAQKGRVSSVTAGAKELSKIAPKTIQEIN